MQVITLRNKLGRWLEYLLTGQSDFRLHTTSTQRVELIEHDLQVKEALRQVRSYLKGKFSIQLRNPIVVRLDRPQTKSWKWRWTSRFRHVGNYYTQPMGEMPAHMITILPGLERWKFQAVLCHELTHAYQSERALLNHLRGYREGMARWVEYHFLLDHEHPQEARKLERIEDIMLGRMLHKILAYEKEHGRRATCQWLEQLSATS